MAVPWPPVERERERERAPSSAGYRGGFRESTAISELNRAEAERVLDLARSGRLCIRVEHSTDGTVHFKKQDSSGITGRRGPLVSAAVGASLLIAGCSPAEPVMTLEQPAIVPDSFMQKAAPQADAPPGAPDVGGKKGEACAPSNSSIPAKATNGKAAAKNGSKDGQGDRRVTMGCACAPGDPFCDCL